jgi:hypothetical protein
MWNFLWRKEMVLYYENRPVAECVGSRKVRLSVHFCIASILLRQIESCRFVVRCCNMENVQQTVQSACAGLNEYFRDIGLSISESKSEHLLFSRKHSNPSIFVTLNGQCMSGVPKFQHLLWGAHVNYALCCKRMNFLWSMAGVSWETHLDVMLILYRGLIRSILEYSCIACYRMAATHILKLKRIQYRCLRIVLGC